MLYYRLSAVHSSLTEAFQVVESLKKPVSTLEESEIESHLSKGLMIGKDAVDYAISNVEYSNQLIMYLIGKQQGLCSVNY